MVQIEVRKEIILVIDEKEHKLTEEQAKKIYESLKAILEPPVATITITKPEKEYVPYYPIYPTYPNPSYPWITTYRTDSPNTLTTDTYIINC